MANGQDWDQPGQYPQEGYGQQYAQGQPWQPQQYDPGAHQQRIGGQQYAPQPGASQPPYPGYQPAQAPPAWQPPGYVQPPQYAPGPPQPPRRRKRHTVRNLLVGLGALVAVIIGVTVANSPGHTVSTTGSSSNTGADAGGTGGGAGGGAAAKTQTATTGTAITLSGNNSGEQMSVTVTQVISNAQPGDEFSSPPSGDRLYAVQFRLRDTGSAAYSDAPSNGAAVVDSAGQSYQSALDTAASCQSFPGTENIAPGASGLGCIVFEVPQSAKIVSVQFTLDSGFGPQTGQWDVG
jgi:hypothetical protein